MKKIAFVGLLITLLTPAGNTQQRVELGAQIWIEPSQTPQQIDAWMHVLAVQKMPVARLFMMWGDLEPQPGVWNWRLYDEAFRAAERENVHIVATLTPSGLPPFAGGDGTQGKGMVTTSLAKERAAEYIRRVVERYKGSPALDTWLLINEPGQATRPDPLALAGFPDWLKRQYKSLPALNLAWGKAYASFDEAEPPLISSSWNLRPSLDWSEYWRAYHTQELGWLASQVRLYDTAHPLHVNPHALVANLAANNDNLPEWRKFLDSLGSSIHPAWHFSLLPRDRYTLGVSYVNDLVDGAARPKPHWVTELSGGNTISSGLEPLNPTGDEITQWVWTSVGAGARRVIFWLLNARSRGVEAGEWSMLDFQGRPSERLLASTAVAKQIADNHAFFDQAHPVDTAVTLILSLETMNLEDHSAHTDSPARDKDAQVLETLGFYEALSRLGVPPAVRHFDDYEWSSPDRNRIAILPDVRALSAAQFAKLEQFVENGNTLMLTGLSGFYDAQAGAWPIIASPSDQPLTHLTGARLKEVVQRPGKLQIGTVALPYTLWSSTLEVLPNSGTATLGKVGADVTATLRQLPGGGRVYWLSATVGLGAWLTDAGPLSSYLDKTFSSTLSVSPFRFLHLGRGCVLRVLSNGPQFVTVVANELTKPNLCELTSPVGFAKTLLHGEPSAIVPANGTVVTLWKLH